MIQRFPSRLQGLYWRLFSHKKRVINDLNRENYSVLLPKCRNVFVHVQCSTRSQALSLVSVSTWHWHITSIRNLRLSDVICYHGNHQTIRGFASRVKRPAKGKKGQSELDESSDDEDIIQGDDHEKDWDPETDGKMDNEDEESSKEWKEIHQHVPSLRLDAVLGAGLGISRKKVEDAYLSMRLRVNGEKVTKKSKQVKEGDILDLILERSTPSQAKEGEASNDKISVMRIHIMEISSERTGKDRIPVLVRRWKNLVVNKEK